MMTVVIMFISILVNVLLMIELADRKDEVTFERWHKRELKEQLNIEINKVKMLEEECNILRDDLHLEQQLKEDAEAKNKQITLTLDAKAVTEKVMKEINRKIAEMKEKDFR